MSKTFGVIGGDRRQAELARLLAFYNVSFSYICNNIIKAKHIMEKQGEIILYQPDEAVRLEVRLYLV